MDVTVDYSKMTANSDKYDAFTAYYPLKITGATRLTVELKRPFAQINFGTNDLDARAKQIGFSVKNSTIKCHPYQTLDLRTGVVSNQSEEDITFKSAPVLTDEAFPVEGYDYISMNYILAPLDKETTSLTLIVDDDYTLECPNIPIRRNYRTNIYGSLFFRPADIFVDLDTYYASDDDYNELSYDVWDGSIDTVAVIPDDDNVIHIQTASQLARIAYMCNWMKDYADYTIKLERDLDLGGFEWTPIGTNEDPQDYAFSGEFDGNGKTIKNFKIDGDKYPFLGFFGTLQYANVHDITFEDVTIINTSTDKPRTGVLAAYNWDSNISNITLQGNIIVEGYNVIGGIFGEVKSANGSKASITNIKINANEGSYVKLLTGVGGYVGGIVGYNTCTSIANIESNLDVIGYNCYTTQKGDQVASAAHVGGVLGGFSSESHNNSSAWSYTGCKVSGNLSLYNVIDKTNDDNIQTYCLPIGGIVGSAGGDGTTTFNQCSFTGKIFVDNQGEDYTSNITTYNANYKYLGCIDGGTPRLGKVTVND
jgi:hypothetical protein